MAGAEFGPYGQAWVDTMAADDPVFASPATEAAYWHRVGKGDTPMIQPPIHCPDNLFPNAAARWHLPRYVPSGNEKVCLFSQSRGPSCYPLRTDSKKSGCHYRAWTPAFAYE